MLLLICSITWRSDANIYSEMNQIKTINELHPSPGYHYIIFDTNSIIKQEYSGFKNVEKQTIIDEKTSFHAFSISKTFTAVGVMQLVQSNKIKLSDTIQNYLTEIELSEPITIKQLLNHQSGIVNPIPLKWTHLETEHSSFSYQSFYDSIISRKLKLSCSPGKKFSYSNLNYLLLGKLIEKVSGMEYRDYIKTNIVDRVRQNDYMDFTIPTSNHATGYHANSWFQNLLLGFLIDKKKMIYKADNSWNAFRTFYLNGASYGGIICTPNALKNYCQELLKTNSKLLSRNNIDSMLTESITNSGKSTSMALGWFKGKLGEHDYYCHAGGGGGYYSEIRLYPSLGIGSVVMTNSSGMTDKRILDHLDFKYIKH